MNKKISVGLDLPRGSSISEYLHIIDTVPAAYFKINPAFVTHETLGVLSRELKTRGIAWIYDGKLGDVPHTNEQYAKYVFEELGASAVTLNPYVGLEALAPFFKYKDRVSFILCKTTNAGCKRAQDAMHEEILRLASANIDHVGVVYSSLDPTGLSSISPLGFPILSPGVGRQGGSATLRAENIIYSVSRSVILEPNPRVAYLRLLGSRYLSKRLEDEGLVKRGSFTLSSGMQSDFYVDLRELSSHVDLYREVCSLLSEKITASSVLGVESGSISMTTTVSDMLSKPFGFIRKDKKKHGASRLIEGLSAPCDVAILDDVLTTGSSVEKALLTARSEGYNVTQIVVVVERCGGGRARLEALGVEVVSLLVI